MTDPNKLDIARQAVQRFEELRSSLRQEEQRFQTTYPDAYEHLQSINHMRDEVGESINYAKALVSEAGETIGDFIVQKKKTTPHYDDALFLQVLVELSKDGVPEWVMKKYLDVIEMLSNIPGPQYDELILEFISSAARGEALRILAEAGVVTAVAVDKTAANTYFPRNSEAQESFSPAFDPGGQPLTPAVKVPKL